MPRQDAPVTIGQIAAHLGVNKSTVSRAMDPARRHMISAELLQKVEAAAKQLGWEPNRAAATLSTGRSRTVGVLFPDITNPLFPPILRGIEDGLEPAGYFALLANTARSDEATHQAVAQMRQQRVDGFLIASATRDDDWVRGLHKTGSAIVLVNRTDGRGELPAVLSDDLLGMRLAVEHLAGLGHRHIVHLAGPGHFSTGMTRRLGFEQALRERGLEPAGIVECPAYSIEAGVAATTALLEGSGRRRSRPSFTAIVAANDLIALGALQVLKARGVAVPEQVSLIGHNDMPLLDQISPPLTSIRIQHYEMGFRAARLLLEALSDTPGSSAATVLLRPALIERASTREPPA